MATANSREEIERRIKELEKQSNLVRRDIRTLSKAIQKPSGPIQIPRLRTAAAEQPPAPPPARPSTPRLQRSAMPGRDGEDGDLFSPGQPGAATAAAEPRAPAYPSDRRPPAGEGRFAEYFASGSFGKARMLGHERNVQRNRAIVMIILVVVVAFTVLKLVL